MKIFLSVVIFLLAGCSTFESFHLRIPLEIAYGDKAVEAEQAAEVAKIGADKEVMLSSKDPHTVEVKLPPEMMPAIAVHDVSAERRADVPPDLAPGASAMATMNDGTTLIDCVAAKGGLMECRVLDQDP